MKNPKPVLQKKEDQFVLVYGLKQHNIAVSH